MHTLLRYVTWDCHGVLGNAVHHIAENAHDAYGRDHRRFSHRVRPRPRARFSLLACDFDAPFIGRYHVVFQVKHVRLCDALDAAQSECLPHQRVARRSVGRAEHATKILGLRFVNARCSAGAWMLGCRGDVDVFISDKTAAPSRSYGEFEWRSNRKGARWARVPASKRLLSVLKPTSRVSPHRLKGAM